MFKLTLALAPSTSKSADVINDFVSQNQKAY